MKSLHQALLEGCLAPLAEVSPEKPEQLGFAFRDSRMFPSMNHWPHFIDRKRAGAGLA